MSFSLLYRFVSPSKDAGNMVMVNSDGIDSSLNVVESEGPKITLDSCRFDGG